MKTHEQIEIGSYTVNIALDECPDNPFEAWDCEPPLLVYSGHRHATLDAYNGAPETWRELLRLLPDAVFSRGQRVAFLREFLPWLSLREFLTDYVCGCRSWTAAHASTLPADLREFCAEALADHYGAQPSGWGAAVDWFETAAAILEYGGIPCHQDQSNGYSQGDSALVLAIATPEWAAKVGAPADSLKRQCESACELYGFWAWGDVYGVSSIEDERGDEIDPASCWGFYGSNHEKSGLLYHARNAIECHERRNAKQAEHFTAALCPAE